MLRLNPWLMHGGIGVSVQIYTGGALQAQVAIATAQQQQAVARYSSVALTVFAEVENALTCEAVWAERLRYDREALANIAQAVRIAKERYQAGSIARLSVLEIQARQILAEAEPIKDRDGQLANRITLHLALGGSFDVAPSVGGADWARIVGGGKPVKREIPPVSGPPQRKLRFLHRKPSILEATVQVGLPRIGTCSTLPSS